MKNIETLLVHAGEKPDVGTGAVAPILVRTKTYEQKFGEEAAYQYSRGKNPTRNILEEKLAALEGGGKCAVFGSGAAAVAMFLMTLDSGDHILCSQEVYGGTFRLIEQVFKKYNIIADYIDLNDEGQIRKHLRPTTKYLWVETPTNPSLHICDLEKISAISRKIGIPIVADMTFSPPCTTRSFEYGVETVIHSLSKYIAGHNDVLAGAVITKNGKLYEKLAYLQKSVGAILSPDECYRVIQGVKTLDMRWRRVSESALKVAEWLKREDQFKNVFYPGLTDSIGHDIAKRQMKNGFGAVVSFVLKTEKTEDLKKFVEKATESGVITYGESLASPETLLAHPPTMSHKSLPKDVRLSLGITDSFFRLSLGFENSDDVIESLASALS